MFSILPAFQNRADLILQGKIDQVADSYVTPLWTKFRGQFYKLENREQVWEMLSRQYLSQKSRGVMASYGTLEDVVRLAHGSLQVTIHWRERTNPKLDNAARSYRVTYVCRSSDDLRVVGFTLTETQPIPQDVPTLKFPQDTCHGW